MSRDGLSGLHRRKSTGRSSSHWSMIQEIKVTENFVSANHEGGLRDDDRDLGSKRESEFHGVEYSVPLTTSWKALYMNEKSFFFSGDAQSGGNNAQNPLLFFYNNEWVHASNKDHTNRQNDRRRHNPCDALTQMITNCFHAVHFSFCRGFIRSRMATNCHRSGTGDAKESSYFGSARMENNEWLRLQLQRDVDRMMAHLCKRAPLKRIEDETSINSSNQSNNYKGRKQAIKNVTCLDSFLTKRCELIALSSIRKCSIYSNTNPEIRQ